MPDNDWKHRSNYDPETGKKFPRGEMREVPAQKKKPPKKPTLWERIRDHEGILVSDRKSRENFVIMMRRDLRKMQKLKNKQKIKKVGKENGHDVTEARGSGAARPQKFRKNG